MATDDRGKPPVSTVFGVGAITPPPRPRTGPVRGAPAPARAVGPLSTMAEVFTTDPRSQAGTDLAPGMQIEQYELIRELGRGGMGVVYAARDLKLGRRVAMKFLGAAEREVIERFLVEARATAQCNHDNIVIIYEVDQYDGMPYMVLEYIEGRTLRDVIGELGHGSALPSSRVVELMLPVARALARAHELGIVHRDLKPENIMVTTAGQVKVLDFGIAKALGPSTPAPMPAAGAADRARAATAFDTGNIMLTREGALIGTLPYMSPEQMGVDDIDHRSDLYAVGLIMFELLAGRHPIAPLTSEVLLQHLVDPAPLRSVRGDVPDLPEPLIQLVDGLLRKSKHERIGSALELARQLEQLLPGRHGRQLGEGESPYPGLTAFQEQDADRFFGRTRDIARMVARIRDLPLTGIVGPSGVGKSSFIRAGVGPALKASGETWDVVTVRPGRHPLSALATVIERSTTRLGGAATGHHGEHDQVMQRLRTEPGFLGATLRRRAATTGSQTLLFVDQLEELYTLVPDGDERRAFTAALAAVADDATSPLRVVVSMRSDFLDRVGEDAQFLEELSRGLVFLSAPDRDGLREALELPIEQVGYRFESAAMTGDMLDALAGTPGALPLLQFAASKLWDARDRERRLLTMSSYHAIGGVSGALATHADDIVRNMPPRAQTLTQQVFRQLVTPERTRAIVEIADLQQLAGDRDELTRVIDLLVTARLLVVQTRAGGGSVEIVHESLIDRWPTLRRWLDESQEDAAFLAQLGAAAKQWDLKGRPAGLLWRGEAMDEARRWAAGRPRSLGAREQEYLDAVLALARRSTRARRLVLASAFVVLGGIAAAASIAYVQMSTLREQASANAQTAKAKEDEARRALADFQAEQARSSAALSAADSAKRKEEQARLAALQAGKQLELSKEDLEKANAALEAKVAEAAVATRKAQAAAADAQRAKSDLQVKLDAEKARAAQLRQELSKLSTKLKD